MKKFLVAALLILSGCATQPTEEPVSRSAQSSLAGLSCAPKEPISQYLKWYYGVGMANGAPVPKDEVWLIRTAGIASNDSIQLEYMMQIINETCCYHPLEAPTGRKTATPKLAITRQVLMLPGEYLSARTHDGMKDMAILYSYWRFDIKCLPRLLGVERRSIDIDDK